MTAEDLRSLDLLVLFDDHHETFSTHTSSEATGMTRITLNIFDVTPLRAVALATVLSLVFTPLAAQDHQRGVDAYDAGDYATALREWLPLANQGHAYAQFNVGLLYDPIKLYQCGNRRCSTADALALGAGVRSMGITKTFDEALTWYRRAAGQGHARAQNKIGIIFEALLDDKTRALMWYRVSAMNGLDSGASNYNRLRRGYFVQQGQLETLARECINSNYQNCGTMEWSEW